MACLSVVQPLEGGAGARTRSAHREAGGSVQPAEAALVSSLPLEQRWAVNRRSYGLRTCDGTSAQLEQHDRANGPIAVDRGGLASAEGLRRDGQWLRSC
jgi:hypothetical protein